MSVLPIVFLYLSTASVYWWCRRDCMAAAFLTLCKYYKYHTLTFFKTTFLVGF